MVLPLCLKIDTTHDEPPDALQSGLPRSTAASVSTSAAQVHGAQQVKREHVLDSNNVQADLDWTLKVSDGLARPGGQCMLNAQARPLLCSVIFGADLGRAHFKWTHNTCRRKLYG